MAFKYIGRGYYPKKDLIRIFESYGKSNPLKSGNIITVHANDALPENFNSKYYDDSFKYHNPAPEKLIEIRLRILILLQTYYKRKAWADGLESKVDMIKFYINVNDHCNFLRLILNKNYDTFINREIIKKNDVVECLSRIEEIKSGSLFELNKIDTGFKLLNMNDSTHTTYYYVLRELIKSDDPELMLNDFVKAGSTFITEYILKIIDSERHREISSINEILIHNPTFNLKDFPSYHASMNKLELIKNLFLKLSLSLNQDYSIYNIKINPFKLNINKIKIQSKIDTIRALTKYDIGLNSDFLEDVFKNEIDNINIQNKQLQDYIQQGRMSEIRAEITKYIKDAEEGFDLHRFNLGHYVTNSKFENEELIIAECFIYALYYNFHGETLSEITKYEKDSQVSNNQSKNIQQNENLELGRTSNFIKQALESIDRNQSWEYAFLSEADYNSFVSVLTCYFSFQEYTIPSEIRIKRGTKTRLAQTLKPIHKDLSEKQLKSDSEFFKILKSINYFSRMSDIEIYNAMTR